ncbi:extracellular solute-binding protein [Paenibacillus sp. IB182496]|uniref:Extracellular solute-binding protein n=1 Tax=Paenibacillus sabuli TaxID=2772509 RepID=A0A927BR97_9BACL|nr:extracellular solute-binding protein [Paenibacillus sabuli]MBD2844089.1 extracellular solute-binding protein [Paenibacillus sabuli]
MLNVLRAKGAILTLACLLAAMTLLAACSSNENDLTAQDGNATEQPGESSSGQDNAIGETEGSLLSEAPITYKWLVQERREAPIRDDWKPYEEIFKNTNVQIEFEPVPAGGLEDKLQILIATNSPTDFMVVNHTDVRKYGPDGVFLNLKNYLDVMPNVKQLLADSPEAERLVTGDDGGIYAFPLIEGVDFPHAWLVRQDVMEELGLEAPASPEQFYDMLKAMKEAYPDSYPFLPQSGNFYLDSSAFTAIIRSFTGLQGLVAFDPVTEAYAFTPDYPGFREAIEFLQRLYDEELLDPEFPILTGTQWEERMLSGKSLISYYSKSRVSTFNNNAAQANLIEGYKLSSIPVFAADGIENYVYGRARYNTSNGIAIAGDIKSPEIAARFLDYLYSEEGSNLTSLGIEGETYHLVDGEPKFLESPTPYTKLLSEYGVFYPRITLNMEKARQAEVYDEDAQAVQEMYDGLVKEPVTLVLSDEESELELDVLSNLQSYIDQKLAEFVTGRTPISDESFASFLEQSVKLGAHELRDMYNGAYARQNP